MVLPFRLIRVLPVAALLSGAQLGMADPIANGDFGAGDSGFFSAYSYQPNNTIRQTTYDVTDDPKKANGNWASFGDHTSGKGFMMVVNGSTSKSRRVWYETVTVEPNTDYIFSLWTASTFSRNPATLHLQADTKDIGRDFTLSTTTGLWEEDEAFLTTGADTSLSLEIFDTDTRAAGNDFALDDITLTPAPAPEPASFLALAPATLLIIRKGRRK